MKQNSSSQYVDRQQVKELLRVFRKNEWRGAINPLTQKRGGMVSGALGLIGINVFFSLLVMAFLIFSPDIHDGIIIGGLFVMFFVSFQIMLEFGRTIISPEDYFVIAPLPVSSKTFYIAKQVFFLMHVSIVTLSLTIAPVIGSIINSGSALIGLETLVVFWLCGILSAELVSIVYTLMLSYVNPTKMERYLGFAQMALSASFSMTYVLIGQLKPMINDLHISETPYVQLAPSYWFSAPFQMLSDGWQTGLALMTLTGALVLALLYRLSAHTLSLTYAQSLLRATQSAVRVKQRWRIPFATTLWRKYAAPEARAVLTLMRAQFRGDFRFRIQVLVIVPLLLFALFSSGMAHSGGLPDPFLVGGAQNKGINNLYVMLMILPMMITLFVQHSSAYKAAWIYFTTPVNRGRLLTGARTIAFLVELAPMFLGLSGILFWFYPNPLHALLHALLTVSIVRLPVSIAVLINPAPPFSQPLAGSANSFSLRKLLSLFLPAIGVVPLLLVQKYGYGSYLGYALILSASLLLGWALEKVSDPYLVKRFKSWEFIS